MKKAYSYKADIESERSAKRWRYEEDPKENRAAQGGDIKNLEENRAAKTKGGDMKRTSREIALLIGRNISYH